MQPPEGPPVCTALIGEPSGVPPPISSTICRSVVPIGTSTSPVLRTLPARANTFVPLLQAEPIEAYQTPPQFRIGGTLANVSKLLTRVGQPQRPFSAG